MDDIDSHFINLDKVRAERGFLAVDWAHSSSSVEGRSIAPYTAIYRNTILVTFQLWNLISISYTFN